jgi:hypothetical protein
MLNKLTLTAELIHHYPDAPSMDEAMRTWWQNIREDGGLRLTYEGYRVFSDCLELNSYTFELPEQVLTPKNLIVMDRHMASPYYIVNNRKHNHMVMFGSREAMMATLYGDIKKFISSLTH